jgi:hypothetical protein
MFRFSNPTIRGWMEECSIKCYKQAQLGTEDNLHSSYLLISRVREVFM